MTITKISILLALFIFGITVLVRSDPVKSMNHGANQKTLMKVDENKASLQKKMKLEKELIKSSKKNKPKFQPGDSSTGNSANLTSTKVDVNFLEALQKNKKVRVPDSLDKAILSYGVSQGPWRTDLLAYEEVSGSRSSNSDLRQSISKPYPNGNEYAEESRKATFRLLQSKREEIFKEISMGCRFYFNPMRGHLFLEMNAAPSSEKGPGIIIPF